MKCITLTLNPAFDRHCFIGNFSVGREHLVKEDILDAGGKGVNISRALKENGCESLAFTVVGEENGASYLSAVAAEGIECIYLTVSGRVRENITVHGHNAEETRISFEGFSAEDGLLDRVYDTLLPELDCGTIVTFTGRAPAGLSMPAMQEFLRKLSNKGCRIVIDSRSFTDIDDIIAARPWLIKPNGEEISGYLKREIKELDDCISSARELHRLGIENVMISLGGEGALLCCSEGTFIASAPRVEFKSAIGAGDSSIGGFISAFLAGKSPDVCLKTAVAFGSAACMREGTKPPLSKDVDELLSRIEVKRI